MHEQGRGSGVARERTSDSTDALLPPAWRDADDDQGRGLDSDGERPLGRLCEQRLSRDPYDPLNGKGGVGQETARVTPAAVGICLRTDEPEGSVGHRGEPSTQLERRPVVLAASERHEHAVAA